MDDFMALISPAAAKYLEPMAQLSKIYRRTFRQNHLHVYTAVYHQLLHQFLCVLWFPYQQPDGTYHPHPEQIEDEYKAIKKLGPFENLLLVTGENPAKAGVPYLAKALDIAKNISAI